MAFSASEAAFEGFRIIRREPGTIAVWAVALIIFSAVLMTLLQPSLRDVMAVLPTPGSAPAQMNPTQAIAMLGSVGRLYLVMLPIYLVFMSIFTGAIYRAVLRPEEKGFARLMLGGDELRLLGFLVLFVLFMFGVSIVIGIAGVLVMLVVTLALQKSAAAVGLSLALFYLLYLIAYIWVLVRMSLAAPMTFVQQRLCFFESFKLTKGRFWPLFGCYVLAVIFVILILIVDGAVTSVVAIGASGGSLARAAGGLFRPDYSSSAALFTPLFLLRLVIGGAFGAVMSAVMIAAPAAAYREISASAPAES